MVIFSLNRNNVPAVNAFCTTFFSLSLLAWLYLSGWVYESLLNNLLELFFLLNLILTSVAILFEFSKLKNYPAVIYTSTGTVFVIFAGIILYHSQRRLFLTTCGAKLKKKVTQLLCCSKNKNNIGDVHLQCKLESSQQVTHTVVGLTQSLIEEEGQVAQQEK